MRRALLVVAFAVLLAPRAAAASTPSRADSLRASHAVERYYASYGPTAPIPPPPVAAVAAPARRSRPDPAAAPLTRGGPGWNAAVAAGALLFAVGAALGVLAGRDSMRPRRT
jgi:hypothetical protein